MRLFLCIFLLAGAASAAPITITIEKNATTKTITLSDAQQAKLAAAGINNLGDLRGVILETLKAKSRDAQQRAIRLQKMQEIEAAEAAITDADFQ